MSEEGRLMPSRGGILSEGLWCSYLWVGLDAEHKLSNLLRAFERQWHRGTGRKCSIAVSKELSWPGDG